MILVVVSDGFISLVVRDDPALSHGRFAGIADHVLNDLVFTGLLHIFRRSVDIEAVCIFLIESIDQFPEFSLFSRVIIHSSLHFIENLFHEGFAERFVVDIFDGLINMILIHTAFSTQNMNVRIPLKVTAISMEGDDETGSKR